ncbi:MAG: ribosomal protein S18-alanine N-acetyltransferase [Thermoclostridium sp.]|nr:ribosomal protein S18-alanine N-acetyltransferase [Thermoclostridium sp.]
MDKEGHAIEIRKVKPEDIDGIALVETQSFTIPWSRQMFADELNNPLALYYVATCEDKVIAYAGLWIIADEGHITNVAVEPSWRRQQIAARMMQKILEAAEEYKLSGLTLEVRAGNQPAISLYQKFGFQVEGRRRGYYSDDHEDALIMWFHRNSL